MKKNKNKRWWSKNRRRISRRRRKDDKMEEEEACSTHLGLRRINTCSSPGLEQNKKKRNVDQAAYKLSKQESTTEDRLLKVYRGPMRTSHKNISDINIVACEDSVLTLLESLGAHDGCWRSLQWIYFSCTCFAPMKIKICFVKQEWCSFSSGCAFTLV